MLTACGPSTVFDFTEPATGPARSIEFRISDELIDQSEGYRDHRVQESITLTAVESEDPARCAVEYRVDYVEGRLDLFLELLQEGIDATESEATVDQRMALVLTGEDLDSIELGEDHTLAVVPLECAISSTDIENTVRVAFAETRPLGDPFFARAEVALTQDGELLVLDAEFRDR